MKRLWGLLLAVIMLITCSGCYWGWEHDRGQYDDRYRGDRDGYGHDDRGDHDGNRGPDDRH
jgi:hypothetical protein